MARADLRAHVSRIEGLLEEFEIRIPGASPRNTAFRADLAGLLVVLIAATYENCVKDILIRYANSKHEQFGEYVSRKYDRLNSKIKISDLHQYAKDFDPDFQERFKQILSSRKDAILNRANVNICDSYEQILRWRHAFAHEGIHNVTLEEATKIYKYANRVIFCFDEAFN